MHRFSINMTRSIYEWSKLTGNAERGKLAFRTWLAINLVAFNIGGIGPSFRAQTFRAKVLEVAPTEDPLTTAKVLLLLDGTITEDEIQQVSEAVKREFFDYEGIFPRPPTPYSVSHHRNSRFNAEESPPVIERESDWGSYETGFADSSRPTNQVNIFFQAGLHAVISQYCK